MPMRLLSFIALTFILISINVHATKLLAPFKAEYQLKIKSFNGTLTRQLTTSSQHYCYTSTMHVKVFIFSKTIVEQSCGDITPKNTYLGRDYSNKVGDKTVLSQTFDHSKQLAFVDQAKGKQNKAFKGKVPFTHQVYDNLSYQLALAQTVLNQGPIVNKQYFVLLGHKILLYKANIVQKNAQITTAGHHFLTTIIKHELPKDSYVKYWFDQKTAMMIKFVIYTKNKPIMSAILSKIAS